MVAVVEGEIFGPEGAGGFRRRYRRLSSASSRERTGVLTVVSDARGRGGGDPGGSEI